MGYWRQSTAIAQAFAVKEAHLPVLKYEDDEGDLCTLVVSTVDDMLQLTNGKTLRLFVPKPLAVSVDVNTQQLVGGLGLSECEMESELQSEIPAAAEVTAAGILREQVSGAIETLGQLEQKVQAALHDEQVQQTLQNTRAQIRTMTEQVLEGTGNAFEDLEQKVQVALDDEQMQRALQHAHAKIGRLAERALNGTGSAFQQFGM